MEAYSIKKEPEWNKIVEGYFRYEGYKTGKSLMYLKPKRPECGVIK